MNDRDIMKQALDALEEGLTSKGWRELVTALRERLAQPEQEPVWIQPNHLQKARIAPYLCRVEPAKRDDFVPLYTAPPQRRPLSDEQMWELWNSQGDDAMEQQEAIAFARAIEAAHGIK